MSKAWQKLQSYCRKNRGTEVERAVSERAPRGGCSSGASLLHLFLAPRRAFTLTFLLLSFVFSFSPKVTFMLRADVCHQLQTLIINLCVCEPVSMSYMQHQVFLQVLKYSLLSFKASKAQLTVKCARVQSMLNTCDFLVFSLFSRECLPCFNWNIFHNCCYLARLFCQVMGCLYSHIINPREQLL